MHRRVPLTSTLKESKEKLRYRKIREGKKFYSTELEETDEIMIYYKKNIFIPKLKLELEELNKRKDKIENALYILPIHLNILENKNKNELYIN